MKQMAKYSVALALLLTLLAAAGSVVVADESWGGGVDAGEASMEDLIPRMSDGTAYTERYSFSVDLDGGGHVGINLTITNLGVRNGYGASEVRISLPDQEIYEFGARVRRGDWSYDEEQFSLDIAETTIEADGDEAFLFSHQNGEEVRLELRFEKTMQMWRPGNGEIRRGDDYYRFTLVAPRADVTGRIFMGGQWHDVRGTRSGYGDHVATNVAPFDLAKRFTRFRHYDEEEDAFVMWREVDLTSEYGGRALNWVVVGIGDEIVYQDTSAEIRFGDLQRDEDTGYAIPYATRVQSSTDDGRLRFVLRGKDVESHDLLENYGRMARAVAGAVSNPHQYNVDGDFMLEMEAGDRELRLRGKDRVTVDYVNR